MNKILPDYSKPDGKWGWFHYYNPTANEFSKNTICLYKDEEINNSFISIYQGLALNLLFGKQEEGFSHKKYLKKINEMLSKLFKHIENWKGIKSISYGDFDHFSSPLFYIITNKDLCSETETLCGISKKHMAGLLLLLYIDIIIRSCKFGFITDVIHKSTNFNTVRNIAFPDFDNDKFQSRQYGKMKGHEKREKFVEVFEAKGINIFDGAMKYEARIDVIMRKYRVGETTAKKYYSLIKDRL